MAGIERESFRLGPFYSLDIGLVAHGQEDPRNRLIVQRLRGCVHDRRARTVYCFGSRWKSGISKRYLHGDQDLGGYTASLLGRHARMIRGILARIYDWLSPADEVRGGDVIFPLAGRQTRKLFALELYSQRIAPVLLLSVGRFEIRPFGQLDLPMAVNLAGVAAPVPAQRRHFFVALEAGTIVITRVPRGRLGTLGEMRALAEWLHGRPGIRSLLIISSGFHLRRVRLCARALLPPGLEIRYLAAPQDSPYGRTEWWRNRTAGRVVLSEFPKLVGYQLALICKKLRFPGASRRLSGPSANG